MKHDSKTVSQHNEAHIRHTFVRDCHHYLQQINQTRCSDAKSDIPKKPACQRISCDHIVAGAYLTHQEQRCIEHLLQGLKYKHIGQQMQLSVRTIEFYMKKIKKKFHCTRKKELIDLFKATTI